MRYIGFMKTQTSFKSIDRLSLREQIYHSLRSAIINLELNPGEKIRDQELAKQFNVSRTPVREAIKQLEDEGLIVSAPGSVTSVAELNIEEVKKAFVVVATLHALATRLSVPVLKKDDFELLESINENLKQALAHGDLTKAVLSDDHFHDVFLNASENNEITKALGRIVPKIRRLEFAKFDSAKAMDSIKDHLDILEASRAGESEKAAILVEKNWLSLGNMLTK